MTEKEPKKQKKELKGFKHSKDFDENGLLHYLQSNGFHEECDVTSSELDARSADLSYFVDGSVSWMVKTKQMKKISFIAIHFKNIKIKLTHFSLKNYNFNLNENNMTFQGSNDGKNWVNIKRNSTVCIWHYW